MLPNPTVAYVAVSPSLFVDRFRGRFEEMRRQGFEVIAMTGGGPGALALEAMGVEHVRLPVERVWDPARQAVAWLLMTSAFIERRVLLVHSHAGGVHLLSALAARAAGVPIAVATVRGQAGGGLGREAHARALGALVDAYVVDASAEREAAAAAGVPEEALRFVEAAAGVDLEALSPRREGVPAPDEARARLGLSGASRWVGVYGRRELPPIEGLLALIDRVQGADPGVGFAVSSYGEMPPALVEAAVERRGRGRAVALLPTRLPEEMATLYAAADVVALPWEAHGAGELAMEAAAMRRPVVTWDRSDTRDVVVDGQTGYVCAPGQVGAFVEALERLLSSERRRRDLGSAARARAEQRFDVEVGQRHLFSIYDGLIRDKVPER